MAQSRRGIKDSPTVQVETSSNSSDSTGAKTAFIEPGSTMGGRLLGKLQCSVSGRPTEPRDLLLSQSSPDLHRGLEETLKHEAATKCSGVSTTGARSHYPDGTQTDNALTIRLLRMANPVYGAKSRPGPRLRTEFCFADTRNAKHNTRNPSCRLGKALRIALCIQTNGHKSRLTLRYWRNKVACAFHTSPSLTQQFRTACVCLKILVPLVYLSE